MLQVACISDTHISAPQFQSNTLFPAYIRSFPPRERQRAYDRIRNVVEDCHEHLIESLKHIRPTLLLHFGDLCGGWDQRGLGHGGLEAIIRHAADEYRSVSRDFYVAWGNHDVGYRSWQVDPASLAACARIAPLFWSHATDDMLFLGVCEPLLRRHGGESADVTREREKQADFVSDTLRNHSGKPWVLCGHSADIGGLAPQASPYVETMQLFIFGDRHVPWFGHAEKALGFAKSGFEGACRRRSRLCPSAAPLWWRGGAYLRGMADQGRITLAMQRVHYPPELEQRVRAMPFSSQWRSYRYLMLARMGW